MGKRNIFILTLLVQVLKIKLCACQSLDCEQVMHKQIDRFGNEISIISIPAQLGNIIKISVEIGDSGPVQYDSGSLELLNDERRTIEEIKTYGRILWKFNSSASVPTRILRIDINSQLYCNNPSGYFQTKRTYEDQFIPNHYKRRSTNINQIIQNNKSNYLSAKYNINDHFGRGFNHSNIFLNRYIRKSDDYWKKKEKQNNFPWNQTSSSPIPSMERTKFNQKRWVNNKYHKCGTMTDEENRKWTTQWTRTVIGGVAVDPNEFPWLVYLINEKDRKCGASLVSHDFVITAAHCVKGSSTVILRFGKHNLNIGNERGSEQRKSHKIYIHPEYTGDAHADIALVSFTLIDFSRKVRPVCVWTFGPEIESPDGRVVGWGRYRNNDGPPSAIPMTARLTKKACGNDQFPTNDTFCAGGDNNKSVSCHGDSGGGYYVRRGGSWYLQGVISHSAGDKYSCEPIAVFVNVANYLVWLRRYIYC